ncbi:hypothetical protein N7487_012131 [Neofusicoccum parvum]|uniref:Uncharacterized protein n=1 Tax=Neofusicoccum parvum TaxID=310453 RepID=A0ACB5SCC8_9PEZI|nr:hypothetical protein N7487_012131 [Neofusicoccum parvum]
MHFSTATIACALPLLAAAFEFPDFVPLHKRQEPGTPAYECHANCGGVITLSRTDGFCDTSDFTTKFNACMACAVEYDIWQYYGSSVTRAANTCGVEVNLSSSASAETTTAAPSTSAAAVTTAAATTESSEAPETTSSAAPASTPVESSAASSTVAATSSAAVESSSVEASSTNYACHRYSYSYPIGYSI